MSPEPVSVTRFQRASFTTAEHTNGARAAAAAAGYADGWAAGTAAAAAAAAEQEAARQVEHAAALADSQARVNAALRVLGQAAAALQSAVVPVLDAAQEGTLETIVAVAQAALGSELADGPTSARTALTRALSMPVPPGPAQVHLSPADVTALADVDLPEHVQLIPDPTLADGDAVVLFDDGFIDARLSTALSRASQALRTAARR